jgi:hypothetical protein
MVRFDLHRTSELVSLNHEIADAHKVLAGLKGDIERATTAFDKVSKDRTEREAQLSGLNGEVQRLIAVRTESEAFMANVKMQLGSVQIGHRQ